MIRKSQWAALDKPRSGGMLVFMVAGVVMLLAMAMITVDVASMQLARTELRAASDSAAKAGAEALLRTQNTTSTRQAAVDMAAKNTVAGKPLKLATNDVSIGVSTRQSDGSWTFASGGSRPNSVRVNAAMTTGSASGAVSLAFGRIFGAGTFQPQKTSTASVLEQEVCLALDRSASMAFDLSGTEWSYPPGSGYETKPHSSLSRWAALSNAVDGYVDVAADSAIPPRVSLVTWGSDQGDSPRDMRKGLSDADILTKVLSLILQTPKYPVAQIDVRLTNATKAITDMVNWRGSYPIYGATNMSTGLDKAIKVLTDTDVRPFAKRTIILMTDGQWNEGGTPIPMAEKARDNGITVHVITFLPGAQSADMDTVASLTGGKHLHANTAAELIAAFDEIAKTLPVVLTE
jgi:Ca-activated chloride channel homolog